jgi:hypothetical protein
MYGGYDTIDLPQNMTAFLTRTHWPSLEKRQPERLGDYHEPMSSRLSSLYIGAA